MMLKIVFAALLIVSSSALRQCKNHWVGIWGAMPQPVEPANLPNTPYVRKTPWRIPSSNTVKSRPNLPQFQNSTEVIFRNSTLRQTVSVTQDASVIRLQLSNVFGGSDLPITAASVAYPTNGSAGASSIEIGSLQRVTFSGNSSFMIPNGAVVFSDPLNFSVSAKQSIAITLYLAGGQASTAITGHPGSRTTSWMATGNLVTAADIAGGTLPQRVEHWYFLAGIDAWLPRSHSALVIVGDSITDGRGSTTDGDDRWPDQLVSRLQANSNGYKNSNGNSNNNDHDDGTATTAAAVSVINEAAGGNRVVMDGIGPNALGRVDRDVVAQTGVGYAMVFEGVNDIGTADASIISLRKVGDRLLAAYDQIVLRLHRVGIPVFGATITPFGGGEQGYDDPAREAGRLRVNEWIRTSGRFDAVVDFDAAVRDAINGSRLRPEYDSGDYLHLNPAGYKAMAEAVDLTLFTRFADGVDKFL